MIKYIISHEVTNTNIRYKLKIEIIPYIRFIYKYEDKFHSKNHKFQFKFMIS